MLFYFFTCFISLPIEGKVARPCVVTDEVGIFLSLFNNIKLELFHLITVYRRSVSLRLGHVAALTVHRTFIHYRRAASLPSRESLGRFLLTFKQNNQA